MRPDSPIPRVLFAAFAFVALAAAALAASHAGTRHATKFTEPPAQSAALNPAPPAIQPATTSIAGNARTSATTAESLVDAAKPSPTLAAPYGAAGVLISIDPATGLRTMPSPEARRAAAIPALDRSMRGLRVEHRPDGSRRVDLQGRFQEYMVLDLTPEGRKVERCVGASELGAMRSPAAATPETPAPETPAPSGEGR